jgi:myo-inositol 2-dehydrogenase/D-chiro-inositol 1-dehydrogenase
MSQAARIAFVGAGNHSTESLYPNIAHIPEFDLVAVCDLVWEKAESAAKRHGAPAVYTDVVTMLDAEKPDGVCLCGMPDLHREVGLLCLRRGVPVWMEKPPAWDLHGALELLAAAEEGGTWGMVGFMKRFAQANLVAKAYLDSGAIGPLSSVTLIHGSGRYDEIRRMLLFNAIHLIDLGRFLGGEWENLFAYGTATSAGTQAVSVAFRFREGGVGQLNMNSAFTWSDCHELAYVSAADGGFYTDGRELEVMAQKLQFADPGTAPVFGWSGRYSVPSNLAGWWAGGHYTRGYWGELSHFARAVLGQVEPKATLHDGVEDLRIIEAICRSIETASAVTVADVR